MTGSQDMPNVSTGATNGRDFVKNLVMLGICFGLLAGVTEAGIYAVKQHFQLVFFSAMAPHYQWMPAAAYVCLFGLLGCGLALVGCCLPRRWPAGICLRAGVLMFATLYFLININHLDAIAEFGISGYAEVMLALGLAVAIFSRLAARPALLHKLAFRGALVLALLVAVWTAAHIGGKWWAERQMLAELPDDVPKTPNVLLIVWDTVRAESLSLYGHHRPTTPTLDRLAASSVVFDQAIATAPWTVPSHAGMFTGRHVHELPNLRQEPVPEHFTTLAEVLHEKGYLTAGFVANLGYCNRHTGLAQGFVHYADDPISLHRVLETVWLSRLLHSQSAAYRELISAVFGPWAKPAERVNEELLEWLSRRPSGRPFFAFLNFMDAHDPYLPPPPFRGQYGPHTKEDRRVLDDWRLHATVHRQATEEQTRMALKAYDGCIAYLDYELGVLLDELDARGELDNTLVIVTADHGEQFGEHGIFWHGTSLHQPQMHVPLLMRLPGRLPKGCRVAEVTSQADLPATVLDLVEADDSRLPGRSLAHFWRTQRPGEQAVPTAPVLAGVRRFPWADVPLHYPNARGSVHAVWSGGRKYIRAEPHGADELYDLENDPAEKHNLAPEVTAAGTLAQLRHLLARRITAAESAAPPARLASQRPDDSPSRR